MRDVRAGSDWISPLSLAVAAGTLGLPVLYPPEIHPRGLIACGLLAVAALGILAVTPPASDRRYAASLLVLSPLALAAILLAPSRARSLDEAAAFSLLLIVGALGIRLAREARAVDLLTAALMMLGTVAAVQGILQHHIVYPQQLQLLQATDPPGEDGLIVRLAAGRPAGPFILPAVLGTFLAMSLPSSFVLLLGSPRVARRVGLCIAVTLQGYALLLTRSFGAILAASVAFLVLLPLLSRRARRLAMAATVIALVAGSIYFLHSRRAELGQAPGSDPISLRLGNWQAAAGMIVDRPLFGVGPGGFGTSYTLYMKPGMNETRYAHNTYLQIAACWGLWTLVPIGALLIAGGIAMRDLIRAPDRRLALAAAAAAFALHNIIDFGAYLPGIAIPAALIVGAVLGSPAGGEARRPSPGIVSGMRIAAAVFLGVSLLFVIVPQARSRAALEAAHEASLTGDTERAAALAQRATEIRPDAPDAWAFLAEMTLVHWRHDADRWAQGERASRQSVRLDPDSAIRHYTRSLYHLAAGAAAAAYREQAIAHRLFPLKEIYRLPEAPAQGDIP